MKTPPKPPANSRKQRATSSNTSASATGRNSNVSRTGTKKPVKPRPLNVRQLRFCEFVVAGDSQTDSYLKAGWKVPKLDARKYAARLMTKENIKAQIAALRAPQTRKALLSKDRKREIMRDIAESLSQKTQDRLRAIEIDAKLAGDFAPEQHVVEAGPKTIEAVRERAKTMASAMSLVRVRIEGTQTAEGA